MFTADTEHGVILVQVSVSAVDLQQSQVSDVRFFIQQLINVCLYDSLHPGLVRVACNLINKGLEYHHDFVKPNQEDDTLTHPGITFVIHLGSVSDDEVHLEFAQKPGVRYPCRPGSAYVFPGYAIRHRTMRATNTQGPRPRRYSIGIWYPFADVKLEESDERIHDEYVCDDNFEARWGVTTLSSDSDGCDYSDYSD